jgi:hypothetical protein
VSHRIRIDFSMTEELGCWSTREVGTAKERSQKEGSLADAARGKHNSGLQACAIVNPANLKRVKGAGDFIQGCSTQQLSTD